MNATTDAEQGSMPTRDRVVLDIGSGYMLKGSTVAQWFDLFRQYARQSPTEIVIPAVGYAGPLFDSQVQSAPAFLGSKDPFRRWVADAREAVGPAGVVWGKVVVHGGFLGLPHLFLRNQFSNELDQVCIVNPIVQEIFSVLTNEILDHGVDGVVFDLTDSAPNAGSNVFDETSIHCFCDSCQPKMRQQGFNLPPMRFAGPSNPLGLTLKNSESGTAHIDPTREMLLNRDYDGLVRVASSRGFVTDALGDPFDAARVVLDYCEARGRVQAEAIRVLSKPAQDHGKRSAALAGSVDFDQSQQFTLDHLLSASAVDEVWVPDAPVTAAGDGVLLCYTGSRATYNLNAFFEVLETANDIIGSFGIDSFLKRLLRVSRRVSTGNGLSPAAVFAARLSPQYSGVVGCPLFEREHRRIVEDLTSDVTGQVLPSQVLEQFRIAAGPSALAAGDASGPDFDAE
jgi:hypothetical protein